MQAALRHRQLVIAVGGIVAHFHKSAKKFGGLGKFLVFTAKVRQLKQSVGKSGFARSAC